MALNETTLIEEARGITDYPASVISESQFSSLVQTAERDITATTQNYEIDWYDTSDIDGNRALMWTTCLYAKIKAGELDSVDMDIGNLSVETITDKDAVVWYQKARKFIQSLFVVEDSHKNYGSTSVARDNRSYGDDSTTTL